MSDIDSEILFKEKVSKIAREMGVTYFIATENTWGRNHLEWSSKLEEKFLTFLNYDQELLRQYLEIKKDTLFSEEKEAEMTNKEKFPLYPGEGSCPNYCEIKGLNEKREWYKQYFAKNKV